MSAPSNEEPEAGPGPLTRWWRRSHPGRLGTGHPPATVERPGPPPPCSALTPVSGPRGSVANSGRSFAHPCRWRAWGGPLSAPGPPRWGEVSVTIVPGLRVRPRIVVEASALGTCSPSDGPRTWKLCDSSRPLRRAPKGRHTRTPPPGPPAFIFQLRVQRPLTPRPLPRTACPLCPLRRPGLPPSDAAILPEAEESGMSRTLVA